MGIGPIANEADCLKAAHQACGGAPDAGVAPEQLELQTGCECPSFSSVGECKTPPSWCE